MERSSHQHVVIGRVGQPFGIKGWSKVISFCDPQDNIFRYDSWLLNSQQGFEPVKVSASDCKGSVLLVRFVGCDDRHSASLYTNREIAVERSELPPLAAKGEYYWTDLERLQVVQCSGESLGRVDHVYYNGANDVLVVKGDKEHLIPFLFGRTVLSVDLSRGLIQVDWDLVE